MLVFPPGEGGQGETAPSAGHRAHQALSALRPALPDARLCGCEKPVCGWPPSSVSATAAAAETWRALALGRQGTAALPQPGRRASSGGAQSSLRFVSPW